MHVDRLFFSAEKFVFLAHTEVPNVELEFVFPRPPVPPILFARRHLFLAHVFLPVNAQFREFDLENQVRIGRDLAARAFLAVTDCLFQMRKPLYQITNLPPCSLI